ncbi:MAG: ribonuclease H-like domain-containing protein, partial [Polyangiaceae bacterium]
MNLRGKLDRLQMPGALRVPPPPPPESSLVSVAVSVAGSNAGSALAPTLDDLRAKMRAILAKNAMPPRPPPAVDTPELPFVTYDTPKGPLHLRAQRLSASHRMGRVSLLPARDASTPLLALLALDPQIAACDPAHALYLDTETTGLAGGAGTVAFLVGLAYWDGDEGAASRGLMIEQILVRALGEEAPMLEHVASRIRDASMLITYNGKSFDM